MHRRAHVLARFTNVRLAAERGLRREFMLRPRHGPASAVARYRSLGLRSTVIRTVPRIRTEGGFAQTLQNSTYLPKKLSNWQQIAGFLALRGGLGFLLASLALKKSCQIQKI